MHLTKFNDDRVIKIAGQFIFAAFLIMIMSSMYGNTIAALTKRGMLPGFKFLSLAAGIDIGEHLISFNNSSSNLRAIVVGLLNTLSISILAIVFSTALGLFIGLCRLSKNWLVKNIALVYIEVIRNIPLLVLLLFWYRAVFMGLPHIKEAITIGKFQTSDGFTGARLFFSNRGMVLAWPTIGTGWSSYIYIINGSIAI